jgi:hypothetical protein
MSLAKKSLPIYLFVFLPGLLLLFSQLACSPEQRTAMAQAADAISDEVDATLAEPTEVVFAGQVEAENGRWLNDWVVVLFKNGEEVTRTTSRLMESAFSAEGPMDGVFELHIPNAYKLTLAHEVYHPNRALVPMSTVPGMVGTRYLGTWFDGLNPNDMRVLDVPDKQLEYALVVLPMPQEELPDSYTKGNLTFQNGMLVIAPEQAGGIGGGEAVGVEVGTAVAQPISVPQSNVQFTVLPSRNNGQDWHLQMTGYYGSRWDIWEKYVAGRIPGMDWKTFKDAVLAHNPHLETDGFVFCPEKSYLLPFNQ